MRAIPSNVPSCVVGGSPARLGLVLLIVATVAASIGCRRDAQSTAPPPVPAPEVEAEQPKPAGEAAEVEVSPTAAEPAATAACTHDRECEGFLRCIDETCQTPPAITGEADASTPWVAFTREAEEGAEPFARFHVEIADDDAERSRGLMFRRSMKDDWGMLFVFPVERKLSFWMKNTLIPLDMVFLDTDRRVVGVVEGAEPLTLDPRTVDGTARYVLELNAGRARAVGIGPGDRMEVGNLDEAQAPAD